MHEHEVLLQIEDDSNRDTRNDSASVQDGSLEQKMGALVVQALSW